MPRSQLHASRPDSRRSRPREELRVGRYVVHERIAAGGMATVHVGRLQGAAGFSRTVAIKRLLPQFAADPEFETLFVQEARLVARIQHPNVVATLDAVADGGELILVMEYVAGETLARLLQSAAEREQLTPHRIVLRVVRDALAGLHAAHEARDRFGEPLHIVHRDISPHNIMVGVEGIGRVLDFGIAKAATSLNITQEGVVRGKAAYMAPEQVIDATLTRRTDIYAMGIVLWEGLTGERLFPGACRPELLRKIEGDLPPPSETGTDISPELEAVVMRALATDPRNRFATAAEMIEAIDQSFEVATAEEVARWVRTTAAERLAERERLISHVESSHCSMPPQSMVLAGELVDTGPLDAHMPRAVVQPVAQPFDAAEPGARRPWAFKAAVALGLLALGAALAWPARRQSEATTAVAAAPAASEKLEPAKRAAAEGASGPAVLEPGSNPGAEARAASDPTPAGARAGAPSTLDQRGPPRVGDESAGPRARPPRAAEPPAAEPRQLAHGASSKRPPAKAKRRKVDCSPPYTVDAAGRRHYKAECF